MTFIKSKYSDIFIGRSIWGNFVDLLTKDKFTKVLILIDQKIYKLFFFQLKEIKKNILNQKIGVGFVFLDAKEGTKTIHFYLKCLNFLLKNQFNKNSLIVAIGGGIITDLAGFIAGTFYRGISYISVPTTLLAQVDSCFGGKVGINDLKYGKNLIGMFYHANNIFIDSLFLKSLSIHHFLTGVSEIIKYSIIYDVTLFSFLQENIKKIMLRDAFILEKLIFFSIKIKQKVIEKDLTDSSIRKILNFGHTIGHALEAASGYSLSHGEAVSIGIFTESRIAYKLNILSYNHLISIKSILSLFSLPTSFPSFVSISKFLFHLSYDKKNKGKKIAISLPKCIGRMKKFKNNYCLFFSKKKIAKFIEEFNRNKI